MSKVVVWTRHEQVGIGNAFGGFARVMQDALEEDRTLVIYSLIFEKFCEVLPCAMRRIPNDGYERTKGDDVTRASHFQINLSSNRRGPLKESPWYRVSGCWAPPEGHDPKDWDWPPRCIYSKLVRSFLTGGTSGGRLEAQIGWLEQFFVGDMERYRAVLKVDKNQATPVYDAVVHLRTLALIEDMRTEDGLPLDAEAKSEKFVASAGFESMVRCFAYRIAQEVHADRKKQQQRRHAVRRRRRLSSLGAQISDSNPFLLAPLAVNSSSTASMAAAAAAATAITTTTTPTILPPLSERSSVEAAEWPRVNEAAAERSSTNESTANEKRRRQLIHLVPEVKDGHRVARKKKKEGDSGGSGQGKKEDGREEFSEDGGSSSGSGGGGALRRDPRVVSIYLATDAPLVRQAFASRLSRAVAQVLDSMPPIPFPRAQDAGGSGSSGSGGGEKQDEDWRVEVDYFKPSLPPAHFFIWTYPMTDMKEDDWRALVGTTAEWLFMSQGRRMLTVKGLGGGEKALPSSFALSAAAFGRTKDLEYLQSSKQQRGDSGGSSLRNAKAAPSCTWLQIASFS